MNISDRGLDLFT